MTAFLDEVLADLLLRCADADPSLRVVVGAGVGPAARLAATAPDRVMRAAGPTSRLAVADGVRLVGCVPMTFLDAATTDLGDLGDREGAHVLVTRHAAHLAAAFRARLTVAQPAWAGDVQPLLAAALHRPQPTLLRLHRGPAEAPRGTSAGTADPTQHRILHRGNAGLVVGAGATAGVLADVARMLAGRDVHVTAVDAHTISPGTGLDPSLTDTHLLVGDLHAGQAGELRSVRVRAGETRLTMKAVLEALRDP